MEVTSQNFSEALQKIKENLKEAEFVSFDGEFTGLGFGKSYGNKSNDLDTPQDRYQKVKCVVSDYGLIQFGITIFNYCYCEKQYLSSTYCFFLSGNPNGSYCYDASSMKFLAENEFDFNKLFTEGLPFLSLHDEAKAREKRTEKLLEVRCPVSPVRVKDDQSRKFMKDAAQKIGNLNSSNPSCTFPFSSMTGFHRKIIFNNVAPQYPHCKIKRNRNRDLEILFYENEEAKLQSEDEDWEAELHEKIGFNHVVKAILEADLPIVGHNSFSDILHFVDKFLAPLPDTYEEFKILVQSNLPPIYDTKLIAKDPPFSEKIMNTALGVLYDDLVVNYSPPKLGIADGQLSYQTAQEGQAHNAGYDAFMTGVCFATMVKHLARGQWTKIQSPIKLKHLEKYFNRLYFMNSYDFPFFDLMKNEDVPDRKSIYYVECPPDWSHLQIRNLFGKLKSYKTTWKNDTSLFVIPQEESDIDQAAKILEGIRALSPPNVFVSMYSDNFSLSTNGEATTESMENSVSKRPSSISLKRKSSDKETSELSREADSTEERVLKRLKSVGSEQLSNMSLDSPTIEDLGIPVKDKSSKPGCEEFSVPDQW